MRFLADANIPHGAVTELRAQGHNVVYAVVVLFRIARLPAAERPPFIVNALTIDGEWPGYFSVIDERNVRKRTVPRP